MEILFPFHEYWWFYAGFTVFVLAMLALDLGVFHKSAHEVSFKESATWTTVWISLALLFNVGFYFYAKWDFTHDVDHLHLAPMADEMARRVALEFLTGFIVEKALAVDNIFVFAIIFTFLNIPAKYQHRILFYGILGALVFRIIFISIGSVLMQYKAVVILFGVFLLITGFKTLFAPEKPVDISKNPFYRLLQRFLPITHETYGQSFFVREAGRLVATPLFVALCLLEVSDIIFAVDSVPAIFAITKEPLIVFTSNIFAILGLRALYFMVAGAMFSLRYLKVGLGLILIFVGLKMVYLNEYFGGKFPIGWSLGIIGGILAVTVAASLLNPKKEAV